MVAAELNPGYSKEAILFLSPSQSLKTFIVTSVNSGISLVYFESKKSEKFWSLSPAINSGSRNSISKPLTNVETYALYASPPVGVNSTTKKSSESSSGM